MIFGIVQKIEYRVFELVFKNIHGREMGSAIDLLQRIRKNPERSPFDAIEWGKIFERIVNIGKKAKARAL